VKMGEAHLRDDGDDDDEEEDDNFCSIEAH
jgi:hypothetical protein